MVAAPQLNPPAFPNRRHRVRHKAYVPAYASFGDPDSQEIHDRCQVIDISERGLALQCAARVHVDQTVPLRVNLSPGGAEIGAEILAPARVAWFDPSGHVGFDLGSSEDSVITRLHEWLLLNSFAAAAAATSASKHSEDSDSFPQNYTDMLSAASAVQREAESLGADLEAVLSLLATRSQCLLRGSGAAIALATDGLDNPLSETPPSQSMFCRASSGDSAPPVGATLHVDSGFSGECVRTGKPLRCDDTQTDLRVNAETCRAFGIRSALAVPLLAGEKIIGLMEVFSPIPSAFDDNCTAVLQRFADTILAAINRATPPRPLSPSAPALMAFSPQSSHLFASSPEELIHQLEEPAEVSIEVRPVSSTEDFADDDVVGGIRLPRIHLILLVAVAATIFLVLGFLSAPWIQPWIQKNVQTTLQRKPSSSAPTSEPTVFASSAPPIDSGNISQLRDLAGRGDPVAENAMGLLYASGDQKQGIARDETEAARWITKAAEHGNISAQSKLGSLYWAGRGVAKDDNRAYFWTVLARANGDDASKALAPFIASRLTFPQRAAIEQQAEQWLQQRDSRAQAQNIR